MVALFAGGTLMARSGILHTNLDHIWNNFKDLFLPSQSRQFRPDKEDGVVEVNGSVFKSG